MRNKITLITLKEIKKGILHLFQPLLQFGAKFFLVASDPLEGSFRHIISYQPKTCCLLGRYREIRLLSSILLLQLVGLGLEGGLQHEVDDAAAAEVDVLDVVADGFQWVLEYNETSVNPSHLTHED